MTPSPNSLLLVLPVPFLQTGEGLFLEEQACHGVEMWAEHFDKLIVACPVIVWGDDSPPLGMVWRNTAELSCRDRVELVPLPRVFSVLSFLKLLPMIRASLQELIDRSQYLSFAIGGLIGDWAAIAALEAKNRGRPFSVWTDRVEYLVIRIEAKARGPLRKVKAAVISFLMKYYHEYLVRQASLGLFNGQDCYLTYRPFCKNSFLVHDIHTKREDQIDPQTLQEKLDSVETAEVIYVCYVGRADEMKGPMDWLASIAQAKNSGVRLKATWLGDGLLLEKMKAYATELGISEIVEFTGFVADRTFVLQVMRKAHVFLFCHKTPESPRNLMEALISGCPIMGYSSSYAKDLVASTGGGKFVELNDVAGLVNLLVEIDRDRSALKRLIREAAKSGEQYNDEVAFEHRSSLIKCFL